jgi:hypothetical protein
MIIGLTGLKGSGKDEVGAILVKEHGFERRAFADPLKKSIAALFNIPFSKIEQYKNDSNVIVSLDYGHRRVDEVCGVGMTMREFLQRYGTEAHRDVPEMGTDFWVDLTLPHSGYYDDRNIVVTDCRFENEARRIHFLGNPGIVVEVKREQPTKLDLDPHASEQIDYETDYTIFNSGTISDLGECVDIMLNHYSIKHGDND